MTTGRGPVSSGPRRVEESAFRTCGADRRHRRPGADGNNRPAARPALSGRPGLIGDLTRRAAAVSLPGRATVRRGSAIGAPGF